MMEGLRCVWRLETLFLPLYIYCFTKIFLKYTNQDSIHKITLFIFLRFILSISLTPIVIAVLFFFALLADLVHFIAKLYFKDNFVDFAKGGDAMYSGDERPGKGIIPALYYIEEKFTNSYELLFNHFKQSSIKVQRNHPRLQCIHHQFLGYILFLRAPPIGLSFIQTFENYNNNKEFESILNKRIQSPLPCDNKFLWDVTLGKSSIEMHGKKCIPILFRLHHSLGDGVTMMTLLMTNYADDGCENIKILSENLKKLSAKNVRKETQLNILEDSFLVVVKFINWIWNNEFFFGFDVLEDSEDPFAWHGVPEGDISLQVLTLQEKDKFLEKIKAIKNKLNVAFNDVVLGVIGACFVKFFQEKKVNPRTIVTLNPYNLNANNFNDLLTFNSRREAITKLGNKFTIGLITIPIKEEYLDDPKKFITAQSTVTRKLKNSIDFQFIFWMLHMFGSITPLPFVLPINKLYRTSTLVTNLPPLTITRIIGHEIIDMSLSSVHCYDLATCVTLYSYNNISHLSTMMNSTCMDNDQQKRFNCNIVKLVDTIYDSFDENVGNPIGRNVFASLYFALMNNY